MRKNILIFFLKIIFGKERLLLKYVRGNLRAMDNLKLEERVKIDQRFHGM